MFNCSKSVACYRLREIHVNHLTLIIQKLFPYGEADLDNRPKLMRADVARNVLLSESRLLRLIEKAFSEGLAVAVDSGPV